MGIHPWDEQGGPAFPVAVKDDVEFKGMSLRDWFAGQVFPACISRAKGLEELDDTEVKTALKHIAKASYLAADAMLKARKTDAA